MKQVFSDGRWHVVLLTGQALQRAGIQTATDTKGYSGKFSIRVPVKDVPAALEIIKQVTPFMDHWGIAQQSL